MKKILSLSFIAFVLLSFVSNQKLKVYDDLNKALKHPKKVQVLDLASYSANHKELPESLKEFENLEELYLRPPMVVEENQYGHARHYAEKDYQKNVSLGELPTWLADLPNLRKIALGGNPKLNEPMELRKLLSVKSLRYLEVEPQQEISDEFYNVISEFEQLEVLKIENRRVLKYTELALLEELLPNCKIEYHYYEDDRKK